MKRLLQQAQSLVLVLHLAIMLSVLSTAAHAQAWPQKPIRIIVPYTVGGASDITARLMAERFSARLGQPVTVDNRAGASGTIGTEAVAKAPPDGYTLAFVASSHVVNKALFPALGYDPIKNFAPITHTANVQLVMVVPATLQINSVQEFIALARAKPGGLSYASSGSGSNPLCAAPIASPRIACSSSSVLITLADPNRACSFCVAA